MLRSYDHSVPLACPANCIPSGVQGELLLDSGSSTTNIPTSQLLGRSSMCRSYFVGSYWYSLTVNAKLSWRLPGLTAAQTLLLAMWQANVGRQRQKRIASLLSIFVKSTWLTFQPPREACCSCRLPNGQNALEYTDRQQGQAGGGEDRWWVLDRLPSMW